MNQLNVVGYLGADAKITEANGKKFLSFNVADTDKWSDATGAEHETTTWVSCALPGENDNLAPYLVKGQLVFVSGRMKTRIYSSEKARAMVAGVNLAVSRVQLLGAAPDTMPRDLVTASGALVRVNKYYQADPNECNAQGILPNNEVQLFDRSGNRYFVTEGYWVGREEVQTAAETQQDTTTDQQQQDNTELPTEQQEQPQESKTRSRKK